MALQDLEVQLESLRLYASRTPSVGHLGVCYVLDMHYLAPAKCWSAKES